MSTRYPKHRLRERLRLDGLWDFAFLGDVEIQNVDVGATKFDDVMAVPGCFDATPRYAAKRGVAAYRRHIAASPGRTQRICFEGVNHRARVFADAKLVCEHESGFTAFSAELPASTTDTELVVLVDNRIGPPHSELHRPYYDWYHFGGISRSVWCESLTDTWIEALEVETLVIDPPRLRVRLRYARRQGKSGESRARLSLHFDQQRLSLEDVSLESERGTIERTLELPGASLWSPKTPNLHLFRAELAEDDYGLRIGIRKLDWSAGELRINGEAVQLRGVNRHQSHPEFGHAIDEVLDVADIQLLRDLGANFVRSSHYPASSTFLDLCDETGLMVWNEAIGWQQTREQLVNPGFVGALLTHTEEMVAMSREHPSLVIWGVLNEAASHQPECRPAYEKILTRIHELDPSRPVTYASNHPRDDQCFDLADIISINCYPGWYHDDLEKIPALLGQVVDDVGTKHPHKPILIAEIGAAGLYGHHEWHHGRWSEDYQAELLERALGFLLQNQRVSGVAIWQFCDTRTSDALPLILSRPRGFNNKGLVDEYRRPKAAYGVVRRVFQKLSR